MDQAKGLLVAWQATTEAAGSPTRDRLFLVQEFIKTVEDPVALVAFRSMLCGEEHALQERLTQEAAAVVEQSRAVTERIAQARAAGLELVSVGRGSLTPVSGAGAPAGGLVVVHTTAEADPDEDKRPKRAESVTRV
jgi:hypothetical protein